MRASPPTLGYSGVENGERCRGDGEEHVCCGPRVLHLEGIHDVRVTLRDDNWPDGGANTGKSAEGEEKGEAELFHC